MEPVQQAAVDPGVDKIRDILFGAQSRAMEQKLADMQAHWMQQISRMQESHRQEVEQLKQALQQAKGQADTNNLKQSQNTEALSARLLQQLAALEKQTQSQHQQLLAVNQAQSERMSAIDKNLQAAEDRSVPRESLAGLLQQVAASISKPVARAN
jgi:hypothetical protein